MWRYRGDELPPFALPAGPGQESVWRYPRPPRIELDRREVVVRLGDVEIARTRAALRVLETASPPTWYLPWADLRPAHLVRCGGSSMCEWKGRAGYWSVLAAGQRLEAVAWSYETPLPGFEAIRGYLGFYPQELECSVDGVGVRPQPGRFYGGWVTPELVGPFKGEPGSSGW